MAVYLGSDKVGITKELGTDRLQWKCDNVQSLYYEFGNYKGDNLDILQGLDTSKVKEWRYFCYLCSNLTSIPVLDCSAATNMSNSFRSCSKLTQMPIKNTNNVKDFSNCFEECKVLTSIDGLDTSSATNLNSFLTSCNALETIPSLNTSKVTNMGNAFYQCYSIKIIPKLDTAKVTNFSNCFRNCSNLETIEEINLISATDVSYIVGYSPKLVNLKFLNIKKSLPIGKSGSYGYNLSLDSLINTFKELWDLTGSTSQTLTMNPTSKELIANVYVKLVDVTDEMLAQDQYAGNKKPCVVCESTDEGAMTLTEYATSKNWAIA
jgi:surface protein